ncbi:MAG TPA: hypothetical protein VK468_10930 [Pyrinomonadaceae bacterium]|nr:hypothetical protein [Pyrinomonadaceae bacterium]
MSGTILSNSFFKISSLITEKARLIESGFFYLVNAKIKTGPYFLPLAFAAVFALAFGADFFAAVLALAFGADFLAAGFAFGAAFFAAGLALAFTAAFLAGAFLAAAFGAAFLAVDLEAVALALAGAFFAGAFLAAGLAVVFLAAVPFPLAAAFFAAGFLAAGFFAVVFDFATGIGILQKVIELSRNYRGNCNIIYKRNNTKKCI